MSEQFLPQDQETVLPSENLTQQDLEISNREPVGFQTHFQGIMDMYGNREIVAEYLDHHEGWFVRCASPMKAEPFGDNGYTLTIGHYGSLGYELEPKMTVVFQIPEDNFYVMYSISNPDSNDQRYEVDYKSTMNIEEINTSEMSKIIEKIYKKHGFTEIPSLITRINWKLDLQVKVKFPNFIYKLPMSLIQKSGDRLLTEIVKQISPRLSYKVQKDFHTRFNLPIPPKSSRTFEVVNS